MAQARRVGLDNVNALDNDTLVMSISLALFARGFSRPCFCPFGVVQ